MVKLKSLIVLGLFLVLPLCKSFIRILEVIKLVLDRMESTIECITDILKSESLFLTSSFWLPFPPVGQVAAQRRWESCRLRSVVKKFKIHSMG